MTPLILMLCLLCQEADSSDRATRKAIESEDGRRTEVTLRSEELDALIRKMSALEAELKELKSASSQEKGKPLGSQAQSEEEKKKKQLEEEFKKALGETKPAPRQDAPVPQSGLSLGGAGTLKLIDIALDLLCAVGTSTSPEGELRALEAGGHDPKNRGFTVQNVELTFQGVVDPYLRGDAHIVLQIDENGQTTVELEEVYLTTLELPYNLQVKAGQYFNPFGRLNSVHPHAWDFVDQPVINGRMFGPDGLRGPGAQILWLTPLPFFAELIGAVNNANGETATSFRFSPGESVAGRTLVDRPVRGLDDLLYLIRLRTSFDLTDEITLVPGASALFGPNASGLDNRTSIYGLDLYAKWKPLVNEQGWPFVGWQTEAMYRKYQAAAVDDGGATVDGARTLWDWGIYSQLMWGFARPWVLGLRFDYANGQRDSYTATTIPSYDSLDDPTRGQRGRASVNLTYFPSEFSKFRLQYNYDRSRFIDGGDAHSVFLQFEILFGAHGAHKF